MQLAAILGIHSVTLCRWEAGTQKPMPHQVELIKAFARAGEPDRAGFEAGRVLAKKGNIAALYFLLKWVMEGEQVTAKKR